MAKVPFNKLGLKINQDIKVIEYGDIKIEVKQYLPIQQKLTIMGEVLEYSAEDQNFANPIKVETYLQFAVLENYTNLTFTDKLKSDPAKLYDLINSTGFYEEIIKHIPTEEMAALKAGVDAIIESYYKYRCSIYGIIENISNNYQNLNADLMEVANQVKDPEMLSFVKQVLPILGLNNSTETE